MKIAIVGPGRMGSEVEAMAREQGHEVVATLGRDDEISRHTLGEAEVAVEFTLPEAAPHVLPALARAGIDAVSGTTGWSDHLPAVRQAVEEAGTGLIHAPNFSIGVAVFRRWIRTVAEDLDGLEEYDVALHEVHHTRKVDAPSGTARLLAETILAETHRKDRWALTPGDGERGSLDPRVLRITAERVGWVPGTHEIVLDGPDDQIVLRHQARSRRGFARGALSAAEWIRGRRGVFTLDDMLDEKLTSSDQGGER